MIQRWSRREKGREPSSLLSLATLLFETNDF